MQFTGLLDGHGRETYEANLFNSAKDNWQIRYGAWSYYDGEKLIDMYGWYCQCLTKEGNSYAQLPLTAQNAESVSVIGNIYENPELLK